MLAERVMAQKYISTNLCGVGVGRGAVSVDGEAAEDFAGVWAARGILRVEAP